MKLSIFAKNSRLDTLVNTNANSSVKNKYININKKYDDLRYDKKKLKIEI